ncbi:MAG: hypothetical protein EU530_01075 [Promethearchaeota archaeon]|nr:MAG: hypothetical protein EU530_01075 [Candidatus Lokiarchaeota archaeon]
MTTKIPRILIYVVLIGLSLVIGVIFGYTPGISVEGFLSFLFIGIWICYTVEIFIRIKKMKEYRSTLNNGALIFGNLLVSSFYGIFGDFTPFLNQALFPDTFLRINIWVTIFSLPYLIFGSFLLLFSITKYFSVYINDNAFNARKFTVLMGFVFLGFDLVYILLRHGVFSLGPLDFSHLSGTFNIYIIVHMCIIVFFGLIGIFTRNRSSSAYNIDQLTSRMNDIDRRINAADKTSAAARRSERRAREAEQEREKERKKKEAQRRKQSSNRPSSSPRTYLSSRSSRSQPSTKVSNIPRSNSSPKTSARSSSSSQSKPVSVSNKELAKMRPKTGVLSKEDFMCIFCFEMPDSSDREGIVLCPHCRYPAHYREFKEWVRNSKLCSRCDGVLPPSFIQNPKVIPVKTYLKAYKLFKKQF